MNVAQLKEALGEFGDHLPVVVVIDRGEASVTRHNLEVDYSSGTEGEPVVTIEVNL